MGQSSPEAEQIFVAQAEALLDAVETKIERAAQALEIDIDVQRHGNVLEIDLAQRSKIVVNSHRPAREVWVAARTGGFHFRRTADSAWLDTRTGNEFWSELTRLLNEQAGVRIDLSGD